MFGIFFWGILLLLPIFIIIAGVIGAIEEYKGIKTEPAISWEIFILVGVVATIFFGIHAINGIREALFSLNAL